MDKFLTLPDENRKEAFAETASKLEILPIIVEKDFWVCWTLKQLFSTALGKLITFKGGTSLSKAYQLIDRFSEDIDLTISRTASSLTDVLDPMQDDISGKERKRRIDALKTGTQSFVAEAAPVLEQQFKNSIPKSDGWKISLDEDDNDKQILLFFYPSLLNYGQGYGRGSYGVGRYGEGEFGYIKPIVKLEFGARGEIKPSTEKTITPYVADIYPQFFDTIKLQRTCVDSRAYLLGKSHHPTCVAPRHKDS